MSTEELNITTENLVEWLKEQAKQRPLVAIWHSAAADRLEQLELDLAQAISERTPHDYGILRDERDDYRDRLCLTIKEAEKTRTERDEACADAVKAYKLRKEAEIERDSLRDSMALDIFETTQQRDEARAEVERLKREQAFQKGLIPNFAFATGMIPTCEQSLPGRPEPSRLEIAAMIYAGLGSHSIAEAITAADVLIAAAREGGK